MMESSREGSRPSTYLGVTAASSMMIPETLQLVFATCVGISSSVAALAFILQVRQHHPTKQVNLNSFFIPVKFVY